MQGNASSGPGAAAGEGRTVVAATVGVAHVGHGSSRRPTAGDMKGVQGILQRAASQNMSVCVRVHARVRAMYLLWRQTTSFFGLLACLLRWPGSCKEEFTQDLRRCLPKNFSPESLNLESRSD